jgi:hypothetical protein
MKEKILFITSIIGSFSATIILSITHALTLLGVDTTGYVDIINIVGIGLSGLILVAAIFFLNRYSTMQQKYTTNQNSIVATALSGNADLMNTLLPSLADKILRSAESQGKEALSVAEQRSADLLANTEIRINAMMNEMLPTLAEQTMTLVTEQSKDLVDQTTAKAAKVMETMDELIPTYAKQISDNVAKTVRENNMHYHKMLTELKQLIQGAKDNTAKPKLPRDVKSEKKVSKV